MPDSFVCIPGTCHFDDFIIAGKKVHPLGLMELCSNSYTTKIKNLGIQHGSHVNIAQARAGSGGIIICDGYNTGSISFHQLI